MNTQVKEFIERHIDKIIYAGSRSDWERFEFSNRAKFHVVECSDGGVNYI